LRSRGADEAPRRCVLLAAPRRLRGAALPANRIARPPARWFAYWSVAENLFLASRGRRAALVLNASSQIIVRRDATKPCREIGGR